MVPNSAVANLKLLDDLEMGSEGDLFASEKMHQTIQGVRFLFLHQQTKDTTKKKAHNCCVQSYQSIFAVLHQSTDLVFRFLSSKKHWNGSISLTGRWFWSHKLITSVLSLHTQRAWTEREGRTKRYRGSRKRHAVWGATGGRSENYVVLVLGENGSNQNQKIPKCSFPLNQPWGFIRNFSTNQPTNQPTNIWDSHYEDLWG